MKRIFHCFKRVSAAKNCLRTAKVLSKDCFFETVNLNKNLEPDKDSFSGYGIWFDSCSPFSYPGFDWGISEIIFGIDFSSALYTDNKKKYILALGEDPTQGLDNTTITARLNKNFVEVCITLGATVFLFASATKIYKLKTKDSKTKKNISCLGKKFKKLFS